MPTRLTRRDFLKSVLAAQAGLGLVPSALAATQKPHVFSFVLLGDLHYDRLEHHDLEWLRKDKPDDLRQVNEYTLLTRDILPRLFETVRQTVVDSEQQRESPIAFTAQVGDFVEGLCGSEKLAAQQDTDALRFLQNAKLGVPFLFTKGNHDVTGQGAPEAFKTVFQPFLAEQAAKISPGCKLTSARYAVEYGEALFCFFDAYDKESLPWLEATLADRTARHCFVLLHPPVVPYGARSTWHVFSSERETSRRERLLELLGKHNALVLSGHIHKYNLLVRATAGGGRFLQLGLSSVIPSPEVQPQRLLEGVDQYNPEQVVVEPDFQPATEKLRRAVYVTERPFVRQFQYADLPGYAVIDVAGPRVTASIYSGVGRQLWRKLDLGQLAGAQG